MGGRPFYHLMKVTLWIGRQKDSENFVSISIMIKTNNDSLFLIFKYGFFKFCLMFLAILKLTYLQNFILKKYRALTLTEFYHCYQDCCLVLTRDLYILKPTADRAFLKNILRLLTSKFFCKKHHKLLVS